MRTPPHQKESGFSLLEVIWATGILAITLTGALALVLHTTQISENNQNMQKARNAAKLWMNRIEAKDDDQRLNFLMNNTTFCVKGLEPQNPTNNCAPDEGDVGEITYETDPNISPQSMYENTVQVDIIVRWKGLRGTSEYKTSRLFSYQ